MKYMNIYLNTYLAEHTHTCYSSWSTHVYQLCCVLPEAALSWSKSTSTRLSLRGLKRLGTTSGERDLRLWWGGVQSNFSSSPSGRATAVTPSDCTCGYVKCSLHRVKHTRISHVQQKLVNTVLTLTGLPLNRCSINTHTFEAICTLCSVVRTV